MEQCSKSFCATQLSVANLTQRHKITIRSNTNWNKKRNVLGLDDLPEFRPKKNTKNCLSAPMWLRKPTGQCYPKGKGLQLWHAPKQNAQCNAARDTGSCSAGACIGARGCQVGLTATLTWAMNSLRQVPRLNAFGRAPRCGTPAKTEPVLKNLQGQKNQIG